MTDRFHYSAAVRQLGEQIGFGALMQEASAQWRMAVEGELGGSEHVVGPCASLTVECPACHREAAHRCDWCCGSGWVTKRVAQAIAAARTLLAIGGKSFRVELDREADGRWIADVPELPGIMVYGSSREEAIELVRKLAKDVLRDQEELA